MELKINNVSYPIVMYGYIGDGKLLVDMLTMSAETARELLTNPAKLIYINNDGVETDYTGKKFDSFLELRGKTMMVLK